MKLRRPSQRMRGRWYRHRVEFMAGIVFAAMCAAPAPATAATWWWNTLTTGLWTNGANWSNAASAGSTGTAPTNDTTTDVVVFNTTGTNGAVVSQLSQNQSIGGITVNNTGATTLRSDSTTTRQLSLGVGGITVNSGAGAFTIGTTGSLVNIAIAGSQTWTNNSSSLLAMSSGTLSSSVAGTQTLTIAGSGSTTLGSVLANGSGTLALAKTGAGTLTLTALSTFTGGLTVTGGTLALLAQSGTGPIQANQNFSITNATLTTTGSFFNALGRQAGGWTSGTATINAGGLIFAGNTSGNSHNLFDVVLSGGTMGAGAGTLDTALANFYIAGGITATGSTASTISASLGRQSGTIPNTTLPIAVGAGSTLTVSGPIVNINGANGLTKTGAGLLTLSATNTYTGATTVTAGTLAMSAGWNGTPGTMTVANATGTNATLLIQSGSYGMGGSTMFVGGASGAVGTVTQTGGGVAFNGGFQLLIGNSGGGGVYTLSNGTVTAAANVIYGVILGVNSNSSGTFAMSGGSLNMTAATGAGGDATLQIGRYDSPGETGQSGVFTQTGGVASVGILSIGGSGSNAGTGGTQALTLTGGTFSANQFPRLSAGNSNVATITISGSADVTLPAFPTARGTGATATLAFNGGVLRPSAASTTYLGGLTSASIRSGGATLDIPTGRDITITQALLADGTSPGGGLTKTGAGKLTLSAANTYTGNTVISGGTLALSSGASIAQSGFIQAGTAASPGGVLDVTALGSGLAVASGQKLGGYGTVLGNVLIANGAIVAPGGSIGSLTDTGTMTWGGGGRYQFEITNANGSTPGTDWDLLTAAALNITAGTENPFIIDLQTLTAGSDTSVGAMTAGNWDASTDYQWKFLVATNTTFGTSNFNLNWFDIQTTNFLNGTSGGTFSVAYGGSGAGGLGGSTASNELYIVYAAVPEPGTLALAGIGLAAAGLALWKRPRRTTRAME